MSRLRKSEAQSIAESRPATFADEHAASWAVRFDRPAHEPTSLRGYVAAVRDAYEAECPTRLHRHDVDGGGTPAYTAAFEAWLWGSPFAIDHEQEAYRTPLRAALAGMARGGETSAKRAAVAYRVATGTGPVEAAVAEGVPEWCAKVVARDALRVTWGRLSTGPMPLAKKEAVA